MQSNDSSTEPSFPHNQIHLLCTIDEKAKKSLNMIEKMMDPNIIDYYIINCAIPSIIT